MTTSKFEGFEKSAPRSIPSTRTEEAEVETTIEGGVATTTEAAEEAPQRRRVGSTVTAQFDAGQSQAKAEAPESEEETATATAPPKKRKKVGQRPTNGKAAATTQERAESAWDAPGYPSIQEFAKAFVDHTESMLSRVLEKEAEIARLQQKMVDRLTESSEFNKKDAAFVGLIVFIMIVFGLLYFLRG